MAINQEYLTGNRKIRYPFADDSMLSADDTVSLAVFGCFVDAFIQLKSPYIDITPGVTGIRIVGGTLHFDLVPRVAGMPSTHITCVSTRNAYTVIADQTDWCWYTFVMASAGVSELCEIDASTGIPELLSEDMLSFSERSVGRNTRNVRSLMIYGGKGVNEAAGRRYTRLEALELEPDAIVNGDVKIRQGYNMSFAKRLMYRLPGDKSKESEITLNAAPGEGLGRLPCECTDVVEFKTPGLLSNDGHTRLFNDKCYDLLPMRFTPGYTELRMQAKCKACCTCEMYVSIVNDKLVPLKDEVMKDNNSLKATQDKYEEYVDKWNERIENAYPQDIVISTSAVPLDAAGTDIKGNTDVRGTMSRCGFSIMARNDSFVHVTIEFSEFSSNGDPFEAQLSYMDEDLSPVVAPIALPFATGSVTLPPGRSATFTCFIRLRDMVKTDEQSGFITSMKVTAKQGSRVIVSKVERLVI